VPAGLAEELLEQLAAAVGHLRLVDEPVVGLDERADPNHAHHAGEVTAELVAEHREAVEDALPRGRLRLLEGAPGRHGARGHQRAVAHRQLAGDVDEVARPDRRHVGRDRLGGGRERQAEGGKVVVEGHAADPKGARGTNDPRLSGYAHGAHPKKIRARLESGRTTHLPFHVWFPGRARLRPPARHPDAPGSPDDNARRGIFEVPTGPGLPTRSEPNALMP
jgi:hypothetical protein